MQIIRDWEELERPERGCVLSIGNFDGVHRGHQAILNKGRELAKAEGLPLVVLTFDPAPVRVLRPEQVIRLLTPVALKIELLRDMGVDVLLLIEPTVAFLEKEPEAFVEEVLMERLGARHIVEGQTFSFGRRRSGTMVSIKEMAARYGFGAHLVGSAKIELEDFQEVALSSTLVRQLVQTNQLEQARRCLGRPYTLVGEIVQGRGQGKELGYPTANLRLADKDQLVPEDGVFAGGARLGESVAAARGGRCYAAAVSIGRCETFVEGTWQIEAFLLDYEEGGDNNQGKDLYGQTMLLELTAMIRKQEKFASAEALHDAIGRDCEAVRRLRAEKGQS